MVSRTIDSAFVERVRRGQYEVDARAVAEAMIRRWKNPGGFGRSAVLVPREALDRAAVRADERESKARGDLA
jgi:hypothetical protein